MRKLQKNSTLVAIAFYLGLSLISPLSAFAESPATVNLGSAANFVILSKTGISTTGSTSIVGDLGLSPAAATYITGFALTLPSASAFSTSAQVTGKVYAPGYADPTSTNLTTAVLDMQTAYTDATGRAATVTELGAGNIGGLTLAPGVYKWSTGVTIPTDVTLSGSANDIWIFQIAGTLTVSSGVKINLSGGAQARNIFWVVAGQTTIGTTAVFNGNILDQTAIILNTGATLNGRALAQTAVTLDSNAVTAPTASSPAVAPAPTPAPAPAPVTTPTPAPAQVSNSQASVSSNQNVTALQAQLNGLLATAQSLNAQVELKQRASVTPPPAAFFGQNVRTIAVNLGQGSRGNNVMILQNFLISQNKGPSAKALASAGATAYFGSITRSALAEFQKSVGINPALGNFGAITRAHINANY